MENENNSVTVVDSSESPCSALLERLKNLRKWQDKQREELIRNQLIDGHQTLAFKQNEDKRKISNSMTEELNESCSIAKESGNSHNSEDIQTTLGQGTPETSVGAPCLGLSQELISSRNPQEYLHEDYESPCESPLSKRMDGALSSVKLTQTSGYDNNLVSSSSSVLPSGEDRKKKPSPELLAKSIKNEYLSHHSSQGVKITKLEVIAEESVGSSKVLHDNDVFTQNESLKDKIGTQRKVEGLSNFIKCNAGVRDVALKDGGPHLYHNLETKDDDMESTTKPKFAFLRRGEGTSRFGMKSLRFKQRTCQDKVNGNKVPRKADEKQNGKCHSAVQTSYLDVNKKTQKNINQASDDTPSKYQSKVSNRPVKRLQLEKKFAKIPVSETVAERDGRSEIEGIRHIEVSHVDQIFQRQNPKPSVEYDKQGFKEQEELSAFEKLEELADDSSFSSNSSTVIRLLHRGQHSSSSTPVRSLPLADSGNSEIPNRQQEPNSSRRDGKVGQVEILMKEKTYEGQFPPINVSQVLKELKRLVKLDIDETNITQEELETLIESYIDPNTSLPLESLSHFEKDIKHASSRSTSTPAVIQEEILPPKPRVHFRPEGVEVLEYELSESCEEENTLTDTSSIIDDTDLVATSDLEVLAHLNVNGTSKAKNFVEKLSLNKIYDAGDDESSAACLESSPKLYSCVSKSEGRNYIQPLKLQFSPPQQPRNSASHYIWSIFGKEKGLKKDQQPPKLNPLIKPVNSSHTTKENMNEKLSEKAVIPEVNKKESHQDVETYKTLLLAKTCELEKEIESFKKEKLKLQKLQESFLTERDQLDNERRKFQDEVEREKRQLKEYIDKERNELWKNKQALNAHSTSLTSVRDQSLEIVFLKEQLSDLKEEAKKKDSLHQLTIKKLNEKIRVLEEEVRLLQERKITSQKIEKENLRLKQELDRMKVSRKDMQNSNPGINATGKRKMVSKMSAISSINKSLDRAYGSDTMVSRTSAPRLKRTSSSGHLDSSRHVKDMEKQEAGNKAASMKDIREISQEKATVRHVDDRQHPSSSPITHQESFHTTPVIKTKDSPASSLANLNIDCTELCRDDGTRELIYANGNKKLIHPDGSVVISYYNGDRKEIYEDRTVYVYGTDHTSHTTFSDGKEVLEFPNGQKETRLPDGWSEIVFSDNTRKTALPDGTETCSMKDGTIVRTNPDGIKVFEFVSGQREIHTPEEKRREYPDGTVKILHQDGRTETRYKKGRVRIKDKEGNMLIDTHHSVH